MFFRAAGEDGGDTGDAELGGLLDGPLEVIELEDGEQEVDGEGGVGRELFVEGEGDFGVLLRARGADGGDFGAMEEAVGDDVEYLARLGAESAARVGWPDWGDQVSAIQRRLIRQWSVVSG